MFSCMSFRKRAAGSAEQTGREFMLREYGLMNTVNEVMRGRPHVGVAKRGASPTVRGRISGTDYAACEQLEDATGHTRSELVRAAVHNLLTEHNLVS